MAERPCLPVLRPGWIAQPEPALPAPVPLELQHVWPWVSVIALLIATLVGALPLAANLLVQLRDDVLESAEGCSGGSATSAA